MKSKWTNHFSFFIFNHRILLLLYYHKFEFSSKHRSSWKFSKSQKRKKRKNNIYPILKLLSQIKTLSKPNHVSFVVIIIIIIIIIIIFILILILILAARTSRPKEKPNSSELEKIPIPIEPNRIASFSSHHRRVPDEGNELFPSKATKGRRNVSMPKRQVTSSERRRCAHHLRSRGPLFDSYSSRSADIILPTTIATTVASLRVPPPPVTFCPPPLGPATTSLFAGSAGHLAMWLIPLLRRLTSGGPAYLPPVAPLPLRRGLSRQVHQPKCHSAYLCVVPTKPACPVVRFFPLFLSPSLSLSLSLSFLLSFFPLSLFLSFSLSLSPSLFLSLSLSHPFSPACVSSFSPPTKLRPSPSVFLCPLRRRLTQQCGVVVSCHPALRQRSSRTCVEATIDRSRILSLTVRRYLARPYI